MKAAYQYLEHTADILFQAEAETLEELFRQCALAVEDAQIDVATVKPNVQKTFTVQGKDEERLLFDFIDELIYLKDAELLVFSKFDISIEKGKDVFTLTCTGYGEELDHKKHDPKVDVKAVTLHLFEVKKVKDGWKAQVLLDI